MASDRSRADPQKSLVGFAVGEVAYAVPISHVREIVNPLPLTVLPHSPPAVAGVADHRGDVVPVIDLRARFGLAPRPDPRRCKWVLVEVEGRVVGLAVDQVTDVFGTGGAPLKPAPALGPGDADRGIVGVTSRDGVLTMVLDVTRFDQLAATVRSSSPPRSGHPGPAP